MSDLASQILHRLLEEHRRTLQTEVHCEFPFPHRDRRAEIALELQNNGYIRNYDFYGKTTMRCTLTQKALQVDEE